MAGSPRATGPQSHISATNITWLPKSTESATLAKVRNAVLFQPIGSVRRALNIIRAGKFVRALSAPEAEPLKELKRGAFRYRGNRKNPAF